MAIFCKWRGPDQGISQNVQGQGCHWAGEKGRQETSWNSARRNAKSCNPLPWQRAGNCLAGERTSFTGASKGQQHPWMYEEDYGQGMQRSNLSPLVSPWLVWPLQIQERHWSPGARSAEGHWDGCGVKHLLGGWRGVACSVWRRDIRPQSRQRAPQKRDQALHCSASQQDEQQMRQTEIRADLMAWKEKLVSHEGSTERLCHCYPWRFSRSDWIKPWATWSDFTAGSAFRKRLG